MLSAFFLADLFDLALFADPAELADRIYLVDLVKFAGIDNRVDLAYLAEAEASTSSTSSTSMASSTGLIFILTKLCLRHVTGIIFILIQTKDKYCINIALGLYRLHPSTTICTSLVLNTSL